MLDPKLLRENPNAVKEATRVKRIASPELVDAWLKADEKRRQSQLQADNFRAEQRKISEQVGQLKRQLKGGTNPEVEKLVAQSNELKAKQQALTEEQSAGEAEANQIMLQLPAIPDPTWPIGADANENKVVRTWSDPSIPPKPLNKNQLDHASLGVKLGILDFERGVKLAGSRSYIVCGHGALLYNAVLRFAMDFLTNKNYQPFVVPVLVTEAAMIGTGYFPAGRDQAYITQDNSVLVGTSEVPLASYHCNEVLNEAELPKKYCALSTCFRREAGAAGKDTAGLYRVHQFDKVEQVIVHKAEETEHIALHEEIIANAEQILQAIKLPYRVVQNCTGDMGQGKWRMYDIETWMPSRGAGGAYGETHSGSALKDFQARRLNLRYRPKEPKANPQFCYTLNNTAIACPRVLISILELYQQADGSVIIPEILRPYMHNLERITP
ncbi:MAG TPA: serine--tRNA ligase [Tepidisphaeraceae bacterium]|nr:serine--tRNA ligase [Tepidisphaeraceae bacterium]